MTARSVRPSRSKTRTQRGCDGRTPAGSTGCSKHRAARCCGRRCKRTSIHDGAGAQHRGLGWPGYRAYPRPTRLSDGRDRVRGSRLTSRRSTSAPTSHTTPTSPCRTRCRPPIAAELRHVIVLASVEPRHERAASNSHIFQITRIAANYLKVDRLLVERMELWSTAPLLMILWTAVSAKVMRAVQLQVTLT